METRILVKGQITDIADGFNLGGYPFSLYVRPKQPTMALDLVVDCRLICDKAAGPFPVPMSDWTPAMIVHISPNAIDLTEYDAYWGASEKLTN